MEKGGACAIMSWQNWTVWLSLFNLVFFYNVSMKLGYLLDALFIVRVSIPYNTLVLSSYRTHVSNKRTRPCFRCLFLTRPNMKRLCEHEGIHNAYSIGLNVTSCYYSVLPVTFYHVFCPSTRLRLWICTSSLYPRGVTSSFFSLSSSPQENWPRELSFVRPSLILLSPSSSMRQNCLYTD
jgi:hypothetical protein